MEDVLLNIFEFLDVDNIYPCIEVNKLFYKICLNNNLWEELLLYYFPDTKIFKINHNETFKFCYSLEKLIKKTRIKHQINGTDVDVVYNLSHIYLHDTFLRVIPPVICNLFNVRSLFLTNNKITIIPTELGNLYNLRAIDLEHNYIEHIPTELVKLKNLKVLNLKYNKVTKKDVPPELRHITHVKLKSHYA
jgi:Leucine-rich repeat (LRR) protein